jgi:putative transcriptional regulator
MVFRMISFEPLWKTMKKKGISQYKLIKEYKISTGQLDRLRKNGNVSTYTLDQLCHILDCGLEDVATYHPDTEVKP